jgi:hypothetical protein
MLTLTRMRCEMLAGLTLMTVGLALVLFLAWGESK